MCQHGRMRRTRARRARVGFVWLATAMSLLVLPAGCSCVGPPAVQRLVVAPDGVVLALVADEPPPDRITSSDVWGRWARSDDGGRTWQELDEGDALDATRFELLNAPAIAATEVCRPDGSRCWRVQAGTQVEVRDANEQWRTAFAFSESEVEQMRRRQSSCAAVDGVNDAFATVVRSGDAVVVAMGSQGVLRLDDAPMSGHLPQQSAGGSGPAWSRVAVLEVTPLELPRDRLPMWWSVAQIVLIAATFGMIGTALGRGRSTARRVAVAMGTGATTVLVVVVLRGPARDHVDDTTLALVCGGTFLVALIFAARADPA